MAGFLFCNRFWTVRAGLAAGVVRAIPVGRAVWIQHHDPQTWWLDRLKGLLVALVLGYPLLVLILKLVDWTGGWWWLWAWGA